MDDENITDIAPKNEKSPSIELKSLQIALLYTLY